MKPRKQLFQCSSTTLVLALLCATLASAQEVEDENEFSYNEESGFGPRHWGEIRPEWKDCSSGRMQSPIDLLNKRVEIVSHLGRLQRNYKPANATLVDRGHDMMLRWTNDAGYIQINGIPYYLRQCHWHSPSEHTLNGRKFDMEVHLVHESNDNRIVIGIMYKIGRPDSFLSMMKHNLEEVASTHDVEKNVGTINPGLIKFGSRKYYRYIGSLTVPPCTQDILWTVVRKVRTVTREQIKLIRDAVHDDSNANARPVQALHDRPLQLFRPEDRGN